MAADQSLFVCMTVNVRPAIVTVPVLSFLPGGAAALYATDPLPVPLAPDVTVIQFVAGCSPSTRSRCLWIQRRCRSRDPFMETLVGLIE